MSERLDELVVIISGSVAGRVIQQHGDLTFSYDEAWTNAAAATPLSLAAPLEVLVHPDRVTRNVLSGLLPDNDAVLERWGRTYQVSARNPFALLRHVGEDCAGAAQFVLPDRVDDLLAGRGDIEWITEAEVADRLRILTRDPTAWHTTRHEQFSLAGAQAKTALHRDPDSGRWGEPSGAIPTTHILKPAVTGFDDHDLNEHLCLVAARALGLTAARTSVTTFEDQRAIVVERYDRMRRLDRFARVHQEDLTQSLSVPPADKYESDGGPTVEQIVALLRRAVRPTDVADQEVARFVDALAFNWLVAGTDAHAKNYSVLLSGRQVRLAPLYDIASALPYDEMYEPKLKMAMRIGGEYRLGQITGRHWRRLAEQLALDPDAVIARIDELAAGAPDAMAAAAHQPAVRDLGSPLPDRLVERVAARAEACRDDLARARAG